MGFEPYLVGIAMLKVHDQQEADRVRLVWWKEPSGENPDGRPRGGVKVWNMHAIEYCTTAQMNELW